MNKPKVMYILGHYPQISETYIQAEIEAVSEQYEVIIIALNDVNNDDSITQYKHHNPYIVAEGFDRLCYAIEMFKPQLLHTHWLIRLSIVSAAAKKYDIPFTMRAHSFDTMPSSSPNSNSFQWHKIAQKVIPQTTQNELCLGVLAYPFSRPYLESNGVPANKILDCYPAINFSRFYDTSPNGDQIMNTGACIPKKKMRDFIDLAIQVPERNFVLYPVSYLVGNVKNYNTAKGHPVTIHQPVEPSDMPAEYKKSAWLVYTASKDLNQVGWPLAAAEAQAAGVGVLLPNLRPDMRDYIGDSGYIYSSIEEAAEIIKSPPPKDIRQRGFENARKSDIQQHKHLLTDLWHRAL